MSRRSSHRGAGAGEDEGFSMAASIVQVVRIAPYTYIHVLDTNTNVTRVICGPKTYTKQDHERLVCGPTAMITVPPRHYCIVRDPVILGEDGTPTQDKYGQFRLRHGDSEIRRVESYPDPFPLYPGESLDGGVRPYKVVPKNSCLKLKAVRPFFDDKAEVERHAGDEWHFNGPATFTPRVEVEVVSKIKATVVKSGQALRLRAIRNCVDLGGVDRMAGEEWLHRKRGAFLPGPDEEVVTKVSATILTDKKALHLSATKDFVDVYGQSRRAGEEWLVTNTMATSHILDVAEDLVAVVPLTTLSNREYCVVVDPYVEGVQKLGTKELRQGEAAFFLAPGESVPGGIRKVEVLADDEALLLTTDEAFLDSGYVTQAGEVVDMERQPGDRWMVYGPTDYVPLVNVNVLERRRAIPLDENEGVYVRDNNNGAVTAKIGSTYMLKPNESLWEKELTDEVEALLAVQGHGEAYVTPRHHGGSSLTAPSGRVKCRVVAFRVAHNSACQVYDYKAKSRRVVFGPDLVMLGPDEEFTVMRLSGDKPKRPGVIQSLTLMLGPDFMTDIVTVETADHARLNLTLSYNWHFAVASGDDNADCIFNVRDFVGDACKAIASRVRGAVAAESFDNFHKYSARTIRASVFGLHADGRVKDELKFEANSLVITNVDVQSVEPVDERTRESLVKSVQLAIEITTNSQEARAQHEAKREEEEAKGLLERQQLQNEADAEAQRKHLLQLRAESAAVETQGQAKAEAEALAEAARIKGEADVKQAELRSQAMKIESEARLEQLQAQHAEEIEHQRALIELEVTKSKRMADIEASKFAATVTALGADTIASIARAGPEMQAKLLQGLGLKGFLVTDGRNPINLFQTAQGMIAPAGMTGQAAPSEDEYPDSDTVML